MHKCLDVDVKKGKVGCSQGTICSLFLKRFAIQVREVTFRKQVIQHVTLSGVESSFKKKHKSH